MKIADIDAFCHPGAIQFAVATLENWESLCAVLRDLKAEGVEVEVSVMLTADARARARASIEAGEAGTGAASALLDHAVELRFPGSQQRAYCTAGKLAGALGQRQAEGARNLADALTGWVTHHQAVELQSQIDRGRLVVWLDLSESEHRGIVCGRFVRASIDIVELCSIDLPQVRTTPKHPVVREQQ